MIELGRVLRRLDGFRVEVEVIRHADCGDCRICGSFTDGKPNTLIARNLIGAGEGDTVRMEVEPKRVVGLSALVFLLPILAFVVGYVLVMIFIGQGTAGQTALHVAGGLVVMVLSFIPVVRYSKNQKIPLVRVIARVEPPVEIGDLSGSR
ncbi:SoxR reducing system RseC family protein [bacterium]|nr:SoxR reducing system RseC family protein [bacterium]